jgi:hypothetical protein
MDEEARGSFVPYKRTVDEDAPLRLPHGLLFFILLLPLTLLFFGAVLG